MIVEIKKVKSCRNKAFGNFTIRGKENALITISMKLNKTLAEFASTTLHELLHLYFTLLRKHGFRSTNRAEHRAIYDVEDKIISVLRRHYRNGKARTN